MIVFGQIIDDDALEAAFTTTVKDSGKSFESFNFRKRLIQQNPEVKDWTYEDCFSVIDEAINRFLQRKRKAGIIEFNSTWSLTEKGRNSYLA